MKDWSHILTHLGEDRDNYFRAVAPPLIQSSNFAFRTVADFRLGFTQKKDRHLYTRGNNPTTNILQKKLAAMEGAEEALVLASGSAAIAAAVIANVKAGDHIISVQNPYAWTGKLIGSFLQRFGVESTFVDARNTADIAAAIRPNTRVLMLESPNSLTYEIQDLAACAALAKAHNIVSIIDNSYSTPYYQNPLDFGIDIVLHSGSKYLAGHSDILFGVICSTREMISKIFESEYMTLGAVLSPNDAWLALKGLRTLPIRLEKVSQTAVKVLDWLKQQPQVDYIRYPFDESFDQYELAKKQMRGAGGLFSVNFKADSIEKMEEFSNALADTFLMAVSWGAYESLQVPSCVFYGTGHPPAVPVTYVRYYVGLEEADYLIDKFKVALKILD